MFGFRSNHRKREEVQRILLARTNRAQLGAIGTNNQRGGTRAGLTEIVWATPCVDHRNADYVRVMPAVTKDISAQGISFICDVDVTEPCVVIGLKQDNGDRRFLSCTVKHCTPLDDGFFHVGLLVDQVIEVNQDEEDTMRRVIDQRCAASKNQTITHVRVVG